MTRARAITEEAAEAAVDTACRVLRLPTIRGQFAEAADKAEREQLTYRGFLAELLMGECEDRDRRRAERQVRGAGFPRAKWPRMVGSRSTRQAVSTAASAASSVMARALVMTGLPRRCGAA